MKVNPWHDPRDLLERLIASGHAPAHLVKFHVCGQHVECLSVDEDFPACARQGCVHAWPFDYVPPVPPPLDPEIFDSLAVYLPLHAYGPASWGVWFHAERMVAYADRIAEACASKYAKDDVFDIVARHEQYHHLVEAAVTAFELTPNSGARYLMTRAPVPEGSPREPLEELVANAWAFRSAIGSVERRTLQCVMDRVRAHGSPGYGAFDDAMESEPFAAAEFELMGRHAVPDIEFVRASTHARAKAVPVYLWGAEVARGKVGPAARNAVLGPLTGMARFAGRPSGSVSEEERESVFGRFAILKTLGDLAGAYTMLFDELDFETISEVRTALIDWARAAKDMAELEPIVREIDAFERATRWETIEDAASPSGRSFPADSSRR